MKVDAEEAPATLPRGTSQGAATRGGTAAGLGAAAAGPITAVNATIDLTQNQSVTVIGQVGLDATVSAQAITMVGFDMLARDWSGSTGWRWQGSGWASG